MNARTGFSLTEERTDVVRSLETPILSDTIWGYVARPSERLLRRAALTEIACVVSGALSVLAGIGMWLVPGAFEGQMLPFRIAASVALFSVGFILVWISRGGMVQELHVDIDKRQFRLVQRNRSGSGRLLGHFGFDDVMGILLVKPSVSFMPARLAIKLREGRGTVDVLHSDEAGLAPVRERLLLDLVPRRSQPTTPRRSVMRRIL